MSDNPIIAGLLSLPYSRVIIPDTDGSFFAKIAEFPGCFATGDTGAEALQHLEEVAADWLLSTLAQGQEIPPPIEEDFLGKKWSDLKIELGI